MSEIRDLLRQAVARDLDDEPVALLFSGGTDSLSVLWTLLDLGAAVTCYTFRLRAVESNDVRASALACAHWSVPHVIVTEGEGDVAQDVARVVRIIGSARKTHVEVMYAYWHLLQAIKERHVWTGLQADTLYGSNKSAAIKHGKSSAEEFARYRRALLASPDQEGLAQARTLAAHFGKVLHAPYTDSAVRDWFLRLSWRELNQPKQKQPMVTAFLPEFRQVPIYRRDDNLQCGSGIREHMAAAFAGHQRAAYARMLRGA